ncbi:unnamed protein product [Darwinula stevensoni]|uniref:NodB homology domain-containing protein n=1 Tax=Darwinula stevensoni TaxID=69355 RepID=A0A7R9A486_9CRUS|nr:unnamed protein product [Darwinula stevensoni]CAG0882862.1 unnamed protein product [Darwinula stevensoni]
MRVLGVQVVAFFFLQGIPWGQFQEFFTDPLCPQDACFIPDCNCPSSYPPDGLPVDRTPQFIVLSFDDAVTDVTYPLYKELLFQDGTPSKLNPNGCGIGTTFFLSHEFSNYQHVHDLHLRGYEIASHSISHRTPVTHWEDLPAADVALEMDGLRQIVAKFANFNGSYIKGARVPFLQTSGDEYYQALVENNFIYDASRPTRTLMDQGLWPFTYEVDYSESEFLDCQIEPCAKGPFPKFWQVPIVDLVDTNGTECAMLDQCDNRPETYDQAIELLRNNFRRMYEESAGRSPLGLYTHASWFLGEWTHNFAALNDFLDEVLTNYDDVWVVSVGELIKWMQEPLPNDIMTSLDCDDPPPATDCAGLFCGPYFLDGEERNFVSCVACPREYPWVGNPDGQ